MSRISRSIPIALLAVACVKRPTTPLESLPASALERAKQLARPDYGTPVTPAPELKSLAEVALAGVPAALKSRVRHEPALDGVAELVARVWLEEQRDLADPVLEQLVWHAGVPGEFRGASRAVSEGEGDSREFFEKHLQGVQWPSDQSTVFGVGRASDLFGTIQVMVVAGRTIAVDPFPKALPAGQKLTLSGRLESPADDLHLLVEDDESHIRKVDLAPGPDGVFKVEVDPPTTPGRHLIEVTGEERPGWRSTLLVFPVWAGVAVPAVPETPLLSEVPNPPDVATWEKVVRERVNGLRAARGAPALTEHQATAKVARDQATAFAKDPKAPGADLYAALGAGGLRTRNGFELRGVTWNLHARIERALVRPSLRQALLEPAYTKLGVAFVPRSTGDWADTWILSEALEGFDPKRVSEDLRRTLNRQRETSGKKLLQADASLDALAQAVADKKCQGAADADDYLNQQARTLTQVRVSAIQGVAAQLLLPATLRQILRDNPSTGETLLGPYTHVGIGVCEKGPPGAGDHELMIALLGLAAK